MPLTYILACGLGLGRLQTHLRPQGHHRPTTEPLLTIYSEKMQLYYCNQIRQDTCHAGLLVRGLGRTRHSGHLAGPLARSVIAPGSSLPEELVCEHFGFKNKLRRWVVNACVHGLKYPKVTLKLNFHLLCTVSRSLDVD